MMLNRFRIRMVERYLAGRMADSEARSFHRRLESDPKLRQLFQEEKTIENALLHDRDSIPVMGTQRLERMLKGEKPAGPPSGTRSFYRAAGGGDGMWPTSNSSMFHRLTEWLTRRESLAAISAIGSVGVALAIYSLADMKHRPAEMNMIPSPAPAPTIMADTSPVMNSGAVLAIDTAVPHGTDSAVPPLHDSSPGGAPPRDSSPAVRLHRAPAHAQKPDEKMVRLSDSTSVRQRTIEGVAMDTVPPKPRLVRAAVRPLDSVEVMRKYMEQQARRKAAEMETSDSVQLKLKMGQQKPEIKKP